MWKGYFWSGEIITGYAKENIVGAEFWREILLNLKHEFKLIIEFQR